ncbi:MAG: hypothetical protein U0M66_06350 [Bacilli bacterium]|nr:hypothetical protein [Bacilli bacterium]
MNLNYAIFRSEPIYTINDLAQIGSHNKRKKKAYQSNPDINLELTKNNIELVPLNEKYVKGFYNLTKEYKKELLKKMNCLIMLIFRIIIKLAKILMKKMILS